MGKKTLKVMDDFYRKDFNVGDTVGFFEGSVKILDMDYRNEFGTFILCEYVDVDEDFADAADERLEGKEAHPDNPYEIVGSIHVPGYQNLLAGIGFYVKNRELNRVKGFTFQETWNLLFHEGAVNATASASKSGIFHSKLVDSIEGLPALDSAFWKINAYDRKGKPFAPLTEAARRELRKGMRYAVRNRVRDYNEKQPPRPLDHKDLDQVATLIQNAKNIVVLAGAGLSTSSGIPDYRSAAEGVYLKDPQFLQKMNQRYFEKNPKGFWQTFYQLLEESLKEIAPFPTEDALLATIEGLEPNGGHRFFSWLEKNLKKEVTVCTQNVDGLENVAGLEKVIQMHGNLHECICSECGKIYKLTKVLKKDQVPVCDCGKALRPNVVFFGDQVQGFEQAQKEVAAADLILVVGTGLGVYPFNLLMEVNLKAKTVLINDQSLPNRTFDYRLIGDIGETCRRLKGKLE